MPQVLVDFLPPFAPLDIRPRHCRKSASVPYFFCRDAAAAPVRRRSGHAMQIEAASLFETCVNCVIVHWSASHGRATREPGNFKSCLLLAGDFKIVSSKPNELTKQQNKMSRSSNGNSSARSSVARRRGTTIRAEAQASPTLVKKSPQLPPLPPNARIPFNTITIDTNAVNVQSQLSVSPKRREPSKLKRPSSSRQGRLYPG